MRRHALHVTNKSLHQVDWKDFAIPLVACAVEGAVGLGIETGLSSLIDLIVVTSLSEKLLAGAGDSHTQQALAMVSNPTSTVDGFSKGAIA
jgi:hypothetical protein